MFNSLTISYSSEMLNFESYPVLSIGSSSDTFAEAKPELDKRIESGNRSKGNIKTFLEVFKILCPIVQVLLIYL